MKKLISILLACMMLFTVAYAETNAPAYESVALGTGSVQVYDFGENRLHAYVSSDALGDACYAIESPEGVVLLESTAFAANNAEWKDYVTSLNKPVAGKLMAYHPNGSDTYSADAPYATENAVANWAEGGSIRALTDGFVATFGDAVAADHPADAQIVSFGDTVTLAGLDFVIRNEGDDAYGVEIPAMNIIYIHMIGCINRAGIRSVVMTTVSGTNIDEIPGIIDAVVSAGANVYAFARYCPTSGEREAIGAGEIRPLFLYRSG